MKGTLYLIPAPLGDTKKEDTLPQKVFDIINSLSCFVVEDLRTARRYLSKLDIEKPIDSLEFNTLNEHTSLLEVEQLLEPLEKGLNVGLLSDAGMPCIADPGELLVEQAHKKDIKVVPLVGPSSILLALIASGLNAENFAFNGYLPVKPQDLSKKLKSLEIESKKENRTQLFIETPYRNNKMIDAVLASCAPTTKLCIAANITTDSEYIKTKTVKDWKASKPTLEKIPCMFLINAN